MKFCVAACFRPQRTCTSAFQARQLPRSGRVQWIGNQRWNPGACSSISWTGNAKPPVGTFCRICSLSKCQSISTRSEPVVHACIWKKHVIFVCQKKCDNPQTHARAHTQKEHLHFSNIDYLSFFYSPAIESGKVKIVGVCCDLPATSKFTVSYILIDHTFMLFNWRHFYSDRLHPVTLLTMRVFIVLRSQRDRILKTDRTTSFGVRA